MSGKIVFFSRGPMEELLALNAWAVPFKDDLVQLGITLRRRSLTRADGKIVRARREAVRQKFVGDVAAWNSWAEPMLALEAKTANNPSLAAVWRLLAEADLRDEFFPARLNGGVRIFPSTLDLSGARFGEDAWFNHGRFLGPVNFSGAEFAKDVNFEGAAFQKTANFSNIQCRGRAEWREVRFEGIAMFEGAEFAKDAWFRKSRFGGGVMFRGAHFAAEAGLGACTFSGSADFSGIGFADTAGFDTARFEADVAFDDTRFQGPAWFSGAVFGKAASFDRARFLGKMHFDNIHVAEPQSPRARQLQDLVRRAIG